MDLAGVDVGEVPTERLSPRTQPQRPRRRILGEKAGLDAWPTRSSPGMPDNPAKATGDRRNPRPVEPLPDIRDWIDTFVRLRCEMVWAQQVRRPRAARACALCLLELIRQTGRRGTPPTGSPRQASRQRKPQLVEERSIALPRQICQSIVRNDLDSNCSRPAGEVYAGAGWGGVQGPVVKSWRSTWRRLMPCLPAVWR